MERSKSLDSSGIGLSDELNDSTSNHNNNIHSCHNSNNNTNNAFNIKTAQLRQDAFELRQEHRGSNENLNSTTASSSSSPSSPSLSSPSSSSRQQLKSIGSTLPHYLSKRKRPLQRQRPMEHSDDMDYAADLEEEDEEEVGTDADHKHDKGIVASEQRIAAAPPHHPPSKLAIVPAHQKRLQFQKYRQHSNVAMTPTTPNSPPFNVHSHVANNSNSISSSSYNPSNASASPLPAHSLANHATRSSSTSSATSLDSHFKHQDSFESTVSLDTPQNRRQQFFALKRDNSMHSDSSRYSSLECMLEARKPDPEAILINLGFGPVDSDDILSRIPARFLKPSQVRGIDTDAFVKRLQLQLQLADHSVLGYRGLTGNSDVPPSLIVAKIMQRFEVNERKKSMGSLEHTI